jgi:hypothetical protein
MKFKKYHSINQFRDVVKSVQRQADFKGLDDENNAIYENSVKPIIKFKGTVKVHGTNAGITYSPVEGILGQKRNSLLSADNLASHFGFNQFVQVEKSEYFTKVMSQLWEEHCEGDEQMVIFGEWAGSNIQKGVAVAELEKAFYFFDAGVVDQEGNIKWIQGITLPEESKVYNILDFETFEIEIDFNKPELSVDKLIDITTKVEDECPVGKYFGVQGIGEGVVWTSFYKDQKLIMKVKGEKHSVTKVKKLASVDVEKLESIIKFVDYACTENRVLQAIQETSADSRQHTPDVIRWVANDIIKEETDTLLENGLEWKQVAKNVANKTREIFFRELDKF